MRTWTAVIALAGCAASRPPAASSSSTTMIARGVELASAAELSPALERVAWWLGDWEGAHGSEHWIAASGALFGVSLPREGGFEVLVVDDAPGPGKADGVLRLYAMPGGLKSVEFIQQELDEQSATFGNPAHDFPTTVRYGRDGNTLVAVIGGQGRSERFSFARGAMAPAPELEAADRAFAADVARRGVDGWIAAHDAQGAMITGGGRVEGHAAIAGVMRGVLETGALSWAPIASGRRGDLGYTVGKATLATTSGKTVRSSYVTIWRRNSDGAWRVWFDTGRVSNE
jgi:ketosteroid isomerase-like protein